MFEKDNFVDSNGNYYDEYGVCHGPQTDEDFCPVDGELVPTDDTSSDFEMF